MINAALNARSKGSDVELKSVGCGNCGAALQIPDAVRFVTCNHCGSSLEIKQTADVIYSEKIAQIDERTGRLEQQLQVLQLENELTALDLAWEKSKQQFMVSDKHGHKHVPTRAGAWTTGGIGGGFGLFLTVAGASESGGGMPLAVGLLVMIVCVCIALWTLGKAGEYETAERRYRRNRQDISDRLSELRA